MTMMRRVDKSFFQRELRKLERSKEDFLRPASEFRYKPSI